MARREYEMSEVQLAKLLEAGRPVMYIIVGGRPPSSPQENTNDAWRALGMELGFIWDTVQPVAGKGQRFFTAEERAPALGSAGGRRM